MEVTSGAEWAINTGNRRSYSLCLDIDDLREIKGAEFVDSLTRRQILSELTKATEILVVAYVASEGGMSQDFAQKRIEELRNA